MTASDRAYDFAKERILDGRFAGGELISEGDVAVGVGLSRTPVREAFLRLESEGLLRLYPKRGALVVPVSVAEVESVIETRLLVERFAIEKVIRHGVELGTILDAAIREQEALAAQEREREFVEADREFHRLVVAAAENDILLQLHDSLRDRQSRMGLAALARDEDRTGQILQEHRELAAAVTARDEELARSIVDRHLRGTLTLLLGGSPALGQPL
ncbi:MAG: GntR family transcriptional regulator [Conexibacter sp.]|nr:GntR family transcriptional regulator [Conexibacter sp.]